MSLSSGNCTRRHLLENNVLLARFSVLAKGMENNKTIKLLSVLHLVAALQLAACASEDAAPGPDGTLPTPGEQPPVPGEPPPEPGSPSLSDTACTPSDDLPSSIFFIEADRYGLWKFEPGQAGSMATAFTKVGDLDCAVAQNSPPENMTIDHNGDAIIVLLNGNVVRANTADATCVPLASPPQGAAGKSIKYVPTCDGGDVEALYATNGTHLQLLAPDAPPVSLGVLPASTSGYGPEIVATDDGMVFAYYVGTSKLQRVSRVNGQPIGDALDVGRETGSGPNIIMYSVAYSNGYFYTFFTGFEFGRPNQYQTIVNKINKETGESEEVFGDIDMWVISAAAQLTK